jgi:hypothetical protein
MNRSVLIAVGLLIVTGAGHAEVIVDLHKQPLVGAFLDEREQDPPTGGLVEPAEKANRPAAGFWIIPHYEADMLAPGDSTYFSVRNEGPLPATVYAEFFDVEYQLETTQTYELDSREVQPVAVKFVPDLTIGDDGYARGFIRVFSVAPVAVDFFQLETRNAFAVGGVGYVTDDFCTRWNARFLRFDVAGGTTLSIMVNGPQGSSSSDPATVLGDVYSESGTFLGSFSIRTDEWSLQTPINDLIPPGVEFGVVELAINSLFTPAGIVDVRHEALGAYSVGLPAVCMD